MNACQNLPVLLKSMSKVPSPVGSSRVYKRYILANILFKQCTLQDLKIFKLTGELEEKVLGNLNEYPLKSPRGVAINSKGEIIVSDSVHQCVYVYPRGGAFCDIIWGEVCINSPRNCLLRKIGCGTQNYPKNLLHSPSFPTCIM